MPNKLQSVVLVGKYKNQDIEDFIKKIANFLGTLKINVFIDEETSSSFSDNHIPIKKNNESIDDIDAIIVIGGDGTMMSASRKWGIGNNTKQIPLIGINHGRVGFLTDIPQASVFEALSGIIDGEYKIEERDVISYSLNKDNNKILDGNAINDLVIGRGVTGKLLEFTLFINEEFVYSQFADGIIISNPTGSTAYSLAAGGSILHPNCKVFTIVPICPQVLSNRPIVIDNDATIRVLFNGVENIEYFVDGIKMDAAKDGSYFEITKHSKRVKFIHPKNYSYFAGLRNKLNWVKN